jgi:hypothetical protein
LVRELNAFLDRKLVRQMDQMTAIREDDKPQNFEEVSPQFARKLSMSPVTSQPFNRGKKRKMFKVTAELRSSRSLLEATIVTRSVQVLLGVGMRVVDGRRDGQGGWRSAKTSRFDRESK